MTMKRVNITIDEETICTLDAMGERYGMSRSETIRFMTEAMDELQAWSRLQDFGKRVYAEKRGREPESGTVSPAMMLKAAARCSLDFD